jgi:hypothetical protein
MIWRSGLPMMRHWNVRALQPPALLPGPLAAIASRHWRARLVASVLMAVGFAIAAAAGGVTA